jgi:uncharacterized protein with HEPN domain
MRVDDDLQKDITLSAERIESYIVGITREQLQTDFKTQDAIVRNIEIIGEAARQLSDEFRNAHPQVPWSDIIAMRNILAHAYHSVALDEVWRAATIDAPELVRQLGA